MQEWPAGSCCRTLLGIELPELYSFYRPDPVHYQRWYQQRGKANNEGPDVHHYYVPPFQVDRGSGDVIHFFGQLDEPVFLLQPAEKNTHYIANDYTRNGDDGAMK